ncbi:MAG TPA: GNAT family N-acetyltransferase [Actinomycetes bacterium]|jgi:predicted GNAT family acetyltransferase|nr:GNAT family N-acetyltransferase [Actinomycetes bacterium]
MGTRVVNNPDQHRYEIHVDGTLAGIAQYRRQSGVVTFTHTEVDPAYEGQGLGSVLARCALDELRGSGEQIVPLCPFIAGYLRRHPQYLDLVVPERRVAFQQTPSEW